MLIMLCFFFIFFYLLLFFFFNDTATTEIYTLSLHDALPIWNGMKNSANYLEIQNYANSIRKLSLAMIYHAQSGHPGGCLSSADLLAWLWNSEIHPNHFHEYSSDADRSRFVLSKGHSCPALYAAGALKGLVPKQNLQQFRKLGSPFQGHPHIGDLPWVEASTGSLGQGFSTAIGMALGIRHVGGKGRTFVMLGDGELQEGMVWEGAMCAGHYHLDHLCAVVDYNKMQSDDLNSRIMGLDPLRKKWEAFNWRVIETNGHDLPSVQAAFDEAKTVKDRPTVIIADTIKGKGVSFMEGIPTWHGSVALKDEEFIQALRDLGANQNEIQQYLDGKFHDC